MIVFMTLHLLSRETACVLKPISTAALLDPPPNLKDEFTSRREGRNKSSPLLQHKKDIFLAFRRGGGMSDEERGFARVSKGKNDSAYFDICWADGLLHLEWIYYYCALAGSADAWTIHFSLDRLKKLLLMICQTKPFKL